MYKFYYVKSNWHWLLHCLVIFHQYCVVFFIGTSKCSALESCVEEEDWNINWPPAWAWPFWLWLNLSSTNPGPCCHWIIWINMTRPTNEVVSFIAAPASSSMSPDVILWIQIDLLPIGMEPVTFFGPWGSWSPWSTMNDCLAIPVTCSLIGINVCTFCSKAEEKLN